MIKVKDWKKVFLKNARLCEDSEREDTSDVTNNQAALFLYSRMTHMTDMGIAATATAIIVLGSMMTIGSFISAIVYFLHNKNNR